MLKWLLTLMMVLFLASCGKQSPVIVGVDLPPDNNAPANASVDPSTPGSDAGSDTSSNSVAPVEAPVEVVKVFNAPLVLVRGAIDQQQTPMNTAPGT